MLKPQIVAAAVHGVAPAWCGKLHQRDLLVTEAHRHFACRRAFRAERSQYRPIDGRARYLVKSQRRTVKSFGAIEVGYDPADSHDAIRLEPAVTRRRHW